MEGRFAKGRAEVQGELAAKEAEVAGRASEREEARAVIDRAMADLDAAVADMESAIKVRGGGAGPYYSNTTLNCNNFCRISLPLKLLAAFPMLFDPILS